MYIATKQLFSFRKSSCALAAAAIALMSAGSSSAAPAQYAPHRVIIEARAGLSDAALDNMLKVHGGKRRKLGQSRMYVVELPANASETAVAQILSRRGELKFAEPDRIVRATATANDPYIGNEWHLAKIGASIAWDTTQGAGVTVAILDSGVNLNHPDLVGRLVPGYNFSEGNTDVRDTCGHGTAVAGVAAASADNATGVAGVAGGARIMPVRIAFSDTNGCSAYFSTIASGLTYAADNGARIANISYGSVASSAAIMSAASYMKSKGGLVFISAGNNNIDENVTGDGSMIAVSATDGNDAKAGFSSWGAFVTLSAPGVNMWTTDMSGGYSSWNGTSFSSPLSAGVAALIMSARPDLSGAQVQSLLYSTATDLGNPGRDPVFGYGRVNAAAAVQDALRFVAPADTTAPLALLSAPAAGSTVSGAVPVTVNASDNVGVARVDLLVNGTVVATDTSAPFAFSWDSTGVANGKASLAAVAYDAAGNAGNTSVLSLNVSNVTTSVPNDTTAPTVAISNPVGGTVAGNVAVSVSASDNAGPSAITMSLAIDGVTKATGKGGSLGYSWNTKKGSAGAHTITVTARDAAGNTSTTSVNVVSR